jgi:hypothetical protein
MIRCVECVRFNLRAAERMAAHGFGCCALRPTWEFYPAVRPKQCGHFEPAPAAVVNERLEWLERKRKQ